MWVVEGSLTNSLQTIYQMQEYLTTGMRSIKKLRMILCGRFIAPAGSLSNAYGDTVAVRHEY
jgi:hypothetical protein